MTKSITIGIIGLSPVAGGYDDPTHTHLGAMPAHARKLLYDPDPAKTDERTVRLSSAESVMSQSDVILISSPTPTHAYYVLMALRYDHKPLILCEKPLCEGSYALVDELVYLAGIRNQTLIINFQRRWAPGVQPWLDAARFGRFGKPLHALVFYTGPRTIERHYRDACHGLDLCGAAGIPAKLIDIVADAEHFRVTLDFERSSLTLKYIPEMTPVWDNIIAHLQEGEPLVCNAFDTLRGAELTYQLAPKD